MVGEKKPLAEGQLWLGGTSDRYFRAFDAESGKLLWQQKTNSRIMGNPVAYEVDGVWNYGESLEIYPIDTGRLRRVVEVAAEQAGWGRKLPAGHGLGLAVHRCFVTYVAMVIEAAVDAKGNISVPRVDAAVDCGFHVNPERIRSQIEGATVMGLSLALKGEISFKGGRVEQSNFNDYEVLRIDEAPRETRVHIIPADISVPPSGVGEPGVPPVGPALCNAIFAATGKRIRRLPIRQQVQSMQG